MTTAKQIGVVSAETADAMHATITGMMRKEEALVARVAELERHLAACCSAIDDEVRAGSDGNDTHPMIKAHAKTAKAARAALKGQA